MWPSSFFLLLNVYDLEGKYTYTYQCRSQLFNKSWPRMLSIRSSRRHGDAQSLADPSAELFPCAERVRS